LFSRNPAPWPLVTQVYKTAMLLLVFFCIFMATVAGVHGQQTSWHESHRTIHVETQSSVLIDECVARCIERGLGGMANCRLCSRIFSTWLSQPQGLSPPGHTTVPRWYVIWPGILSTRSHTCNSMHNERTLRSAGM
jgi:hypothetical protein